MDLEKSAQPNFYIDTLSGEVLLGKVALESHIESGGYPGDIVKLGDLLRKPEAYPVNYKSNQPLPQENWSRSENLTYIRWLSEIASPPAKPPKEKMVNRDMVRIAGEIGIGPSLYKVRKYSSGRSLASLYAEAGLEETHRIGEHRRVFKDWEIDDFVAYIKQVSDDLGRRPTLTDFQQLSSGSEDNPSPSMIADRYGSLGKIMELANFPDVPRWHKDDYINWGIKVMRANQGRPPKTSVLIYFSKLGLGPSDRTVNKKFGSVRTFVQAVESEYDRETAQHETAKLKLLNSLDEDLKANAVQADLFTKANNTDEKLGLYSKHLVLAELSFPDEINDKTRIKICTSGIDGKGFIGSIHHLNDAILPGDIESTASYLGVFDYIWPLQNYKKDLRLPVDWTPSAGEYLKAA